MQKPGKRVFYKCTLCLCTNNARTSFRSLYRAALCCISQITSSPYAYPRRRPPVRALRTAYSHNDDRPRSIGLPTQDDKRHQSRAAKLEILSVSSLLNGNARSYNRQNNTRKRGINARMLSCCCSPFMMNPMRSRLGICFPLENLFIRLDGNIFPTSSLLLCISHRGHVPDTIPCPSGEICTHNARFRRFQSIPTTPFGVVLLSANTTFLCSADTQSIDRYLSPRG